MGSVICNCKNHLTLYKLYGIGDYMMNVKIKRIDNPTAGLSIMAHIRRTRHIMMPLFRSYFSYAFFNSQLAS